MKFRAIVFIYLSFLILFRCGNSPEIFKETESDVNTALNGLFATGTDTLKIIASSDHFGKTIDFNLNATRKESVIHLFNEATLVDRSKKMEHYRLKHWITGDSSYVAYELLDFTFNFEKDSWIISDTLIITDRTVIAPTFTSLGGEYKKIDHH